MSPATELQTSIDRLIAARKQVFPTLLEVAGLPPNPANEGHSLLPLVKNPTDATVLAKFNVSYSQVSYAISFHCYVDCDAAVCIMHRRDFLDWLLHTDMRAVCSYSRLNCTLNLHTNLYVHLASLIGQGTSWDFQFAQTNCVSLAGPSSTQ